jgi:hypothetical protein
MAPHLEGADSALVLLFRSTHRPPSPATHDRGPRCLALLRSADAARGRLVTCRRLLGVAVSDADAVRGDVRGYFVDALGDPDGVLILDDTVI